MFFRTCMSVLSKKRLIPNHIPRNPPETGKMWNDDIHKSVEPYLYSLVEVFVE